MLTYTLNLSGGNKVLVTAYGSGLSLSLSRFQGREEHSVLLSKEEGERLAKVLLLTVEEVK